MLELQTAMTATPAHPNSMGVEAPGRGRSDRRTSDHWSTELLDQLDYGLLIVQRDLMVVRANRPARRRLHLERAAGSLRNSPLWQANEESAKQLTQAVVMAVDRALRSTVKLRLADESIVLAVIPLRQRDDLGHTLAMVLLERERICTQLSLAGFGRLHGLTGAEASVLAELCAGHEPTAVAERLGVSISTVRTHVVATRAKVGARSLRDMLADVARMPPIADVLRDATS